MEEMPPRIEELNSLSISGGIFGVIVLIELIWKVYPYE